MNDTIMDINSTLYPISVAQTSVNIALAGNDKQDRALQSRGFNVNLTSVASNPVFAVAGIGAAVTAVYPVSGTATNGKLIPAGSSMTWRLPKGTTHISLISAAGTNLIGVSVDEGV